MRIVATADLHGALPNISGWPEADVLVIAGDTEFLETPTLRELLDFPGQVEDVFIWLEKANAKYEHVIGIAGNHDFAMQGEPAWARKLPWTYLCDEALEINGLKFYGTPWSKTFMNWAFMQPDQDLESVWAKIPDDTDVLIVHGPPEGSCDLTWGGENAGSASLRRRLIQMQLFHPVELAICGHIHEAAGPAMLGETLIANVSYSRNAPCYLLETA